MRLVLLVAAMAFADTGIQDMGEASSEPEVGFVEIPESFLYLEVVSEPDCFQAVLDIMADGDHYCVTGWSFDEVTGDCEFDCVELVRVTP